MMRVFITTLGFIMSLLTSSVMSSDPCNVGLVGETEDGNFHYYPQNEAPQFSGNVESEGSNQWIYNDSEDRSSASSSSSTIGGIPGLPSGGGGGGGGGDVTTINGGTDPPFQFASWRSIIGSRSKMGCGSSVGGYGRGGAAGGGGGGGGGRRYLRGGGNDGKSNENNSSDKVQ